MDGSEFLTLDLLEINSTNNPLWLDRVSVEIAGREVTVLSRASVIKMKSSSTRKKDQLDIELLSDEP